MARPWLLALLLLLLMTRISSEKSLKLGKLDLKNASNEMLKLGILDRIPC